MRSRIFAAAVSLVALAVIATADVTLHPATIKGNTGLTNWSFSSGSVYVGGNANGFQGSGSTDSNGNYAITVEGAQTYNQVNEYLYASSPNYAQFYETLQTSFTPGVGSTVTINLLAQGGTIGLHATTTPPAGGSATVTSIWGDAYASDSPAYYSNYMSAGGDTVVGPMAATTSTVSATGYAYITIQDGNGNTCYENDYFQGSVAGLGAGETKTISQNIDLSQKVCPPPITGKGSMSGTVALNGLPAAAGLNTGYVYASGQDYANASFTSLPFSYSFPSLTVGGYYSNAYMYFGSMNGPFYSYLNMPNQNSYVQVQQGQNTTRDFIADGAALQGNLNINGPLGAMLSSASYFYGGAFFYPDYRQPYANLPNYGASQGLSFYSYSGQPVSNPTSYTGALTNGPWAYSSYYVYASSGNNYVNVSRSEYLPTLDVQGGQTYTLDRNLDSSQADVVFDVVEPPGALQPILISYPYITASMYDQVTGAYTSISAQNSTVGQATPTVHLIGPAGHYQFTAYAQVLGSWVTFASSTVDIGLAANTPAGTSVSVDLADLNGPGLDVDVTFSDVTNAGQTNGSTTNVGPAPPGAFTIIPAFNGSTYLSLSTTATFSGPVKVAIEYDASKLGIPPSMEKFLQLWHYNDADPNNPFWENITDSTVSPNPNTVTHTIYGVTNSFSDFAILLPPQNSHPPQMACVGTQASPVVLATPADSCGITITKANGLAGTCTDAGGGVSSCTFDSQSSLTLLPGTYSVEVDGTANDGSTASCTSYVRVADLQRPSISCGAPATVECSGPLTPFTISASSADNCGVVSSGCTSGPFSLGTNAASCSASDAAGNTSSCSTSVIVVDTKAPSVSVSASPSMLWPPNHQLVPIALNYGASDVCDPHPAVSCSVTSNQPPSGGGSGSTNPDIVWQNGNLSLRAERAGTAGDRIYTITCTAKDASGNTSVAKTTVTVPHDQGK